MIVGIDLSFELKREGKSATLFVYGRIDTLSSRKFEDEAVKLVSSDLEELKINFKNVSYISSSGLRVLLYIKQKMMEKDPDFCLILEDPQDSIVEILDITGFSGEVVDVEYTKK